MPLEVQLYSTASYPNNPLLHQHARDLTVYISVRNRRSSHFRLRDATLVVLLTFFMAFAIHQCAHMLSSSGRLSTKVGPNSRIMADSSRDDSGSGHPDEPTEPIIEPNLCDPSVQQDEDPFENHILNSMYEILVQLEAGKSDANDGEASSRTALSEASTSLATSTTELEASETTPKKRKLKRMHSDAFRLAEGGGGEVGGKLARGDSDGSSIGSTVHEIKQPEQTAPLLMRTPLHKGHRANREETIGSLGRQHDLIAERSSPVAGPSSIPPGEEDLGPPKLSEAYFGNVPKRPPRVHFLWPQVHHPTITRSSPSTCIKLSEEVEKLLALNELSESECTELLMLTKALWLNTTGINIDVEAREQSMFRKARAVGVLLRSVANLFRVSDLFKDVVNPEVWWSAFFENINIEEIQHYVANCPRANKLYTSYIEKCRGALEQYRLRISPAPSLLASLVQEYTAVYSRGRKAKAP